MDANPVTPASYSTVACLNCLFFFKTYYEVMEKLRTPRFIPAISLFVCSYSISEAEAQINSTAERLLCDLRSVPHIVCTIDENVGYLLNTNHTRGVKSALLHMIGNYWSGRQDLMYMCYKNITVHYTKLNLKTYVNTFCHLCLVKVIMENTLRKIYHNPTHPGGLGSVKKLHIAVSEATGSS